jgi:hypothetical protein
MWLAAMCITRSIAEENPRARLVRRTTRLIFCLWLVSANYLVLAWLIRGEDDGSRGFRFEVLAYYHFGAAATLLFFAYISLMARRMRARRLMWTCRCMTVLGLSMCFSAVVLSLNLTFNLGFALPSPQLPVTGNPWGLVVRLFIIRADFWSVLKSQWFEDLWIASSTILILVFAILLFKLAAAQRRKTAASSRP